MDHSRATARKTYHDGKLQEGVLNKLVSNQDIFDKELEEDVFLSEEDLAHEERIQKQAAEFNRKGKEIMVKKLQDREWANLTGGTTVRTARKFILSKERYRMLQAIISWTSPEFSALLLCLPFPDKPTLNIYIKRFLACSGEGLFEIRRDAANIVGNNADAFKEQFHMLVMLI